jgi:ER-bound oxygenase mpaB/B'/Rubber oxygenase, catalytic domain
MVNQGPEYFVDSSSIVRKIWGKSDTILFIFAGAAAEFALNKAVDWLYFTGRLPADPIGRLFSTVTYARKIVFSEKEQALRAIREINHIHLAVENKRGYAIPDWAYRDVLFMLIHYSVASYELLQERLTQEEKEDVYDVFYRMGLAMGLKELPPTYSSWLSVRESHILNDLERSAWTDDLLKQYQKHVGDFRYRILVEAQKLVIPDRVRDLLGFNHRLWLQPSVPVYKAGRLLSLDVLIKYLLLPSRYRASIQELDVRTNVSR